MPSELIRLRREYGFRGQLARVAAAGLADEDRVSVLTCGEHPTRPAFALVVLKGHQEIEAFRQWAIAQRLLTPGADCGMANACDGEEASEE